MKLSEINWDPSMYRKGDEYDPRSPYYEEPPEPEDTDDRFVLDWEVYDKEGHDHVGDGKLTVDVKGKLEWTVFHRGRRHPDDDEGEQEYSITDVDVIKLELNGKTYTKDQAFAEFGKDNFDEDLIKEAVLDEIAKKKMYKIKRVTR
jgi:hypothetical protein